MKSLLDKHDVKWSICVPSIHKRLHMAIALLDDLYQQAKSLPVEIIMLYDNQTRTMGAKMQNLFDLARGEYVCIVNDDDLVSEDYVLSILEAIQLNPGVDVVTFQMRTEQKKFNEVYGFGTNGECYAAGMNGQKMMLPNPVCVWRRKLIVDSRIRLRDKIMAVDPPWSREMIVWVKSMAKIERVLYHWRIKIAPPDYS